MPNRRFLTGWLTDFTAGSYPPRWTVAGEAIWLVDAGASMATRVALALINVNFTLLPWVDKWGCVHERKESYHVIKTWQASHLLLLRLIMVPVLTQVSRWAGTRHIESCSLTAASILAVHLQTWILVDFTVSACTHTEQIDVCQHLNTHTHTYMCTLGTYPQTVVCRHTHRRW